LLKLPSSGDFHAVPALEQRFEYSENGIDNLLAEEVNVLACHVGGDPCCSRGLDGKAWSMLPPDPTEAQKPFYRSWLNSNDGADDVISQLITQRRCGEFHSEVAGGRGHEITVFDADYARSLDLEPLTWDVCSEIYLNDLSFGPDWEEDPSATCFYQGFINPDQWAHEKAFTAPLITQFFWEYRLKDHYDPEHSGQVAMIRISENLGIRSLDFADCYCLFRDAARVCLLGDPTLGPICRKIGTNPHFIEERSGPHPDLKKGLVFQRFSAAIHGDLRAYQEKVCQSWAKKFLSIFYDKTKEKAGYHSKNWMEDHNLFSRKRFGEKNLYPYTQDEKDLLYRLGMGVVRSLFPANTACALADPSKMYKNGIVREPPLERQFYIERLEACSELFRTFAVLTFGKLCEKNLLIGAMHARFAYSIRDRSTHSREEVKKAMKKEYNLKHLAHLKESLLLTEVAPRISDTTGAPFAPLTPYDADWVSQVLDRREKFDAWRSQHRGQEDDMEIYDEDEEYEDEDGSKRTFGEDDEEEEEDDDDDDDFVGGRASKSSAHKEAKAPPKAAIAKKSEPAKEYPPGWSEEKERSSDSKINTWELAALAKRAVTDETVKAALASIVPSDEELLPYLVWAKEAMQRMRVKDYVKGESATLSEAEKLNNARRKLALYEWRANNYDKKYNEMRKAAETEVEKTVFKARRSLSRFDDRGLESALVDLGKPPSPVCKIFSFFNFKETIYKFFSKILFWIGVWVPPPLFF